MGRRLPFGMLLMVLAGLVLVHSVHGTFSIVAYDPEVKEWGVAVQSKFLAVGAVVPFADAGSGAVATQAWGNMEYGPEALVMLKMGIDAETVMDAITGKDAQKMFRQVGIVDKTGNVSTFTGENCQKWAGGKTGDHYAVQGNILTGESVVDAMAAAYEKTEGSLAERLIAALKAGQSAGGDSRGRQSAAILIVREKGGYSGYSDRAVDLRVDDHETPIVELERIYQLYKRSFGVVSYLQTSEYWKQKGDEETATACMDRSLTMAEETGDLESSYLNAVAWSLCEQMLHLDRALKLAHRAHESATEDANIMDTIATLYFQKKQLKSAIEWEEKAVMHSVTEEQTKIFQDKLNRWEKLMR